MSHGYAVDMADLASELLDHVRTDEAYDWWPTREGLTALAAAGQHAGDPHARIGKPVPRRRTTSAAGLLVQLAEAAGVRSPDDVDRTGVPSATPAAGSSATDGPHAASKPDSKAPPGGNLVETLVDIEAAILDDRQTARAVLGRPRTPSRDAARALRELVELIALLDDDRASALVRTARSWTRTARVALAYDAPVVRLHGFHCTICGSQDLRVPADAAGPVRCHGRIPGPWATGLSTPCGETYNRASWLALLDARLDATRSA